MKTNKNLFKMFALLTAFVVLSAFTAKFTDGDYAVSKKSEITWNGKKVTGEHFGTVEVESGSLSIKNGELAGGKFVIDMSTITSTDLTGEYLDKLNGHLKSDDFFGVEKFPTATFVITNTESKNSKNSYKVTGDLTIKSTTKPVTFDAQLVEVDGAIMAVADIVIDRSEYDVRYGSGSFFDDLGDKTIYDDFLLQVKLITE